MRPFALRLAVELPGFVAKAINEQEKAGGPDGVMQYWGISQQFDQSIIIFPLRRLHDIAVHWRKNIERNNCEAQASRIRAILADSGV